MWRQEWNIPPRTSDELFAWKVYTRVWQDVGLRPPGQWIVAWMRLEYIEDLLERSVMHDAIWWYLTECHE